MDDDLEEISCFESETKSIEYIRGQFTALQLNMVYYNCQGITSWIYNNALVSYRNETITYTDHESRTQVEFTVRYATVIMAGAIVVGILVLAVNLWLVAAINIHSYSQMLKKMLCTLSDNRRVIDRFIPTLSDKFDSHTVENFTVAFNKLCFEM